jgi:amino acid transporter
MAILDTLLGKPLASSDEAGQKIGVASGVPVLGLDGLSSSAYGPEAALAILLPLGAGGLGYIGPVLTIIVALLGVLYLSYRQTISAYPGGGGSYTVAKENLGVRAGLFAAAALMLDYILNVAVGISAGMGALVSAVPTLHRYTLTLCLVTLAIITVVNLRGVRESGVAFGAPTYLFVGSLLVVIGIGVTRSLAQGGHPTPVVAPAPLPAGVATASLWLLLRSFASGCTAMTGVEAVSNGVSAFAQPAVKNAQRTLTVIVVLLAALLAGIGYLSHAYGIGAMDQERAGYQSVVSQLIGAVVGRGSLYYIAIASVLAVLALSANTSFADFPRLCRLIADDDFLPHAFTARGRRLVHSVGIMILALLSGALLVAFGGITDRLIPLFAVGAFGAFTLSQAGMVVHWKRAGGPGSGAALVVNAVGAVATAVAVGVIVVAKFVEGAWITLILIPGMLALFAGVKHHYARVAKQLRLDRPLDLSRAEPPVVVVPLSGWTILAERALRFATQLSPDVCAVYVSRAEGDDQQVRRDWDAYVAAPLRESGRPQPRLEIIASPYRRLVRPIVEFVNRLKAEQPDRLIAVVVSELVETHWYQYLLHNHRAEWLKADLLLQEDQRVVVINVPWYLSDSSGDMASASRR